VGGISGELGVVGSGGGREVGRGGGEVGQLESLEGTRGLKPTRVWEALRGAEAPLFHVTAALRYA